MQTRCLPASIRARTTPDVISDLEQWASTSIGDAAGLTRRGAVGRLHGRAGELDRSPAGHPLRAVGRAARSHARGDRRPHAHGAARRDGPRPLAALRARASPGRRAPSPRRRPGRLPSRRDARPADAAHQHRCARHRARRQRSGPRVGTRGPRLDQLPGRSPATHGEPAAGRVPPRGGRVRAAARRLRRSADHRANVGGAARRSALRASHRRPSAPRRRRPEPPRAGAVGGLRQRRQVQPGRLTDLDAHRVGGRRRSSSQ